MLAGLNCIHVAPRFLVFMGGGHKVGGSRDMLLEVSVGADSPAWRMA